jgi:N-acetylglutamate synthase-like GNAT family acetyltransferase
MPNVSFDSLELSEPSGATVAVLKLLADEVDNKHLADEDTTELDINSAIQIAKERDYKYYTVTDETGLIAAACTSHLYKEAESITFIWQIAVVQERRGQGWGKTIMQHIANDALEFGDERIELFSTEDKFFEKLGFVAVHDQDEMKMAASPSVLLSK